jgi:hypothetical protein|tara:strand:+ start:30 stop:650 length:621 start_codon:yes stop_codon:yes gene_type:complete
MLKQNYPNGFHISKGSDDIYWILNDGEDYKGKLSTDLNKAKLKAEKKIGYVPDVVIWHRKSWQKFTYVKPPQDQDSHISCYNDYLEEIRLASLKEDMAKKYSHVGTVGEKISLELEIKEIFDYPIYTAFSDYPIKSFGHKFTDSNGNKLIYFGNSKQFIKGEKYESESIYKVGDKIKIKATIKDHTKEKDNEFIALTVLQRPSIIK